jgi:hypothetical protein
MRSVFEFVSTLTGAMAILYWHFAEPKTLKDVIGPALEILLGAILLWMLCITVVVCARIPVRESAFDSSLLGRQLSKGLKFCVAVTAFFGASVFNALISKQMDLIDPADFMLVLPSVMHMLTIILIVGGLVHWGRLAFDLLRCGHDIRRAATLRLIKAPDAVSDDWVDSFVRFVVTMMAECQLLYAVVFVGLPVGLQTVYIQLRFSF